MDVPDFVKRIDPQDHFANEKLRGSFRENVLANKQTHHVASATVFLDHVEILVVLKGVIKCNDPLLVSQRHNVSLCANVLHLVFVHQAFFKHYLHREYFARLLELHQPHFAECSTPDGFQHLKIGELHLAAVGSQTHVFFALKRLPLTQSRRTYVDLRVSLLFRQMLVV